MKHDLNLLKMDTCIYRRSLLLLGFFLLAGNLCFSQATDSVQEAKKAFEGTWYCRQEKRFIRITFEKGENYATVNEWMSGGNTRIREEDMDVYKVFIEGNKLVFPADNKEHRASYCEFAIVDKKLIQSCNGGLNFTDQFLKKDKYLSTSVFTRKN